MLFGPVMHSEPKSIFLSKNLPLLNDQNVRKSYANRSVVVLGILYCNNFFILQLILVKEQFLSSPSIYDLCSKVNILAKPADTSVNSMLNESRVFSDSKTYQQQTLIDPHLIEKSILKSDFYPNLMILVFHCQMG